MTVSYGPWIEWDGRTKKCPLPTGTRHQVRFRDETISTDDSPETWTWSHVGGNEGIGRVDIVAYRIEMRK